jgi:hypothetical protein
MLYKPGYGVAESHIFEEFWMNDQKYIFGLLNWNSIWVYHWLRIGIECRLFLYSDGLK